jgi:ParB/RepB/Spo0J family partition protein
MEVLDLPIDQIIIRPDRHRKFSDTIASRDGKKAFDELVESIKNVGLINPVTVNRVEGKYELSAGEHRIEAFKVLKRPTIPAAIKDSLSEYDSGMLELEENIRRFAMPPAERMKAIKKLHDMRSAADPSWNQQRTAALVGSRRQADVSQALSLAAFAEAFPDIAAKAKSVNQLMSHAQHKAAQILRVNKVQKDAKTDQRAQTVEEKIWLGDSVERIKEVPDHSFRLVLTDPPFGVDYDNKVSGTVGALTDYSDTEDDYERILSMAPDLYRVLKPDGFLVWFFGISWYDRCKSVFRDAGFTVDEIPVVWDRTAGKCWTRRPDRYFARGYDVALMCIKGDPQIIKRNQPNVIHATPVSTSEREAVVERPIELYKPFIERLTVPGERVADFFVGAGGVPAAAAALQRDFFGIELNPARRAIAINKILAHLPK